MKTSSIPPLDLISCTLPIAPVFNENETEITIQGTSFLFLRVWKGSTPFVITAHHNIYPTPEITRPEEIQDIRASTPMFRYRNKDNTPFFKYKSRKRLKFENIKWQRQGNDDVVVTPAYTPQCNGKERDNVVIQKWIDIDRLTNKDHVFLLGYPKGHHVSLNGTEFIYPIRINGVIESIQDHLIRVNVDLTELQNLGGSSGGPVFIIRDNDHHLLGMAMEEKIPKLTEINEKDDGHYILDYKNAILEVLPVRRILPELRSYLVTNLVAKSIWTSDVMEDC